MSTNKTHEIVAGYAEKYPFIRLLDNPARIVPPAMNTSIRQSHDEMIIHLDAHAIYPADYFSQLTKYLVELDADNVGGVCRTLPMNDSIIYRSIAAVLTNRFGMGNSYFRIGLDNVKQVDTAPFG